ncbi:DNA cytosine methyltransferase [Mycolicibacterium sp. XJ2]
MLENRLPAPGRAPGESGWPPLDDVFLAEFKARGQNYAKAMPLPREVLLVDFFAGAGGMSAGFHSTRHSGMAFRHLAAIDIDAQALETLQVNLGVPTHQLDVRKLAAEPESLAALFPEIDPGSRKSPLVFVGCPPCQGFSAHRKKDSRDDPRNSLIMSFVQLVAYFRPDVIVMENVPEMLRGRFEHYYAAGRDRLVELGYALTSNIVDASLFGVPQRRRRAVVLGSLEGSIELPEPALSPAEVRTVRDAISHLPPVRAGESDSGDPWHRAPNHIDRILRKIERIPANGGDRRGLPLSEQLACHVGVDAGATPGFTDVYGRLRWDEPAVTITAKSSTPSCGRFLHPEQHRNITVREAALLQTFPHNYVFTGNFVGQYRQIGEAVPPLLARHLAFAVLDHLNPMPKRVAEVRDRIRSVAPATISRKSGLRSVDLFCGAGGLSLGLQAAGIPSVFAVDSNAAAIATYQKNIGPEGRVGDVYDRNVTEEISSLVAGTDFVLVGGPPCQGFSQQRRGEDSDPRNDLVLRYAEIATTLATRPMAVVLENVMYLDSPRGRKILEGYLTRLENADYYVRRFDLNSADFGLPQTRRRIVVVAVDVSRVTKQPDIRPLNPRRWLTIGETLAGLPSRAVSQLPNHIAARESSINVTRMSYVDMGRGRTAIPDNLQLDCHRGYDGHLDVFGRLDWFGYARTLTGGFDSSSRGEYTHPFLNRSITAREAARIQGFPDDFEFQGNRADVRRQIGNAVPPPLGFAIGEAVKRAIARK